jgi:four helix bundle protein
LEEGKAAPTRKDVANKFSIALKEARETAYWLKLLGATDLVSDSLTQPVRDEADELIAILTAARLRLGRARRGSTEVVDVDEG